MGKVLLLLFLLVSCSNCGVQDSSNHLSLKPKIETSASNTKSGTVSNIDDVAPSWSLRETELAAVVSVLTLSAAPHDSVQAAFQIHCGKTEDAVTNFDFIIRNTDGVSAFHFNDFEGPYAPAQKRELVSIEALLPKSATGWSAKATWRFFVTGRYGCNGETDAFCFSPSTKNQPNATAQIARFIAKGSVSLAVTVTDYKDPGRTIKAILPPIDPKSEAAKVLNDCRF